jgi:DNA-binding Lrp family transcriptional regulator
MGEREPQSERLNRGELLCLYHPGTTDIFSGYGLVMADGWPGELAGLLMVDRPTPANPAWLARIQEAYGECELVPMTTRGERGLLCRMHIEPESLQHLRRFSPAFGQPLQEALQPLLDDPPAPTLSLSWDEDRRSWLSRMVFANELPPSVREVFERSGYGCLAVESRRGIVHVCHASDEDIDNFLDQPVEARWDLIEMPTAPLVRLELLVYDDPRDPFCFESFLNVAAPDQLAVLGELAGQEELYLAFYGDDLTYRYTAIVPHDEPQWQRLDEIISQAEAYWASLPREEQDFDRAKALYMLIHP